VLSQIPLFGVYSLKPKRVAFRQDYCIHCMSPQIAWREQFWGFLHIARIPVLPLGLIRSWRCSSCHRHPRLKTIPLSAWKVLFALVFFVPMDISFWLMKPEPEDLQTIWLCRAVLTAGILWLGWWISIQIRAPKWARERAKEASLVNASTCPQCGSGLITTEHAFCPVCHIKRLYA
jgi:hypothetical protein